MIVRHNSGVSNMNGGQGRTVRIISGAKRGSKIQFPDLPGLRPSGDRIRETLFAWLQFSLPGCACLDMFSGSGALGFEAASRGADRVVMIEKHRKASDALQENAVRLKLDAVEILTADALSHSLYTTSLAASQFNLVFIDPPFAEHLHSRAVDCLLQKKLLLPDAWVYLEVGKRSGQVEVPADWQLYREKVAGEVRMQLFHVSGTDGLEAG